MGDSRRFTLTMPIGVEDRQRCGRWLNNRAENSHPPFRRRERAMARFRDVIFTTARTSNSIAPPLWPSGVNLRPERPRLLVLLSDPVSLTMPLYEIDHNPPFRQRRPNKLTMP